MRVALYIRLSTQFDVENQLSDLRLYCLHKSYESVVEYIDYQTNNRIERVQFNRMMADVANKSIDLIIFWRLDKLSIDSVAKTLKYLRVIQSYDVNFLSFKEPCINSMNHYKDTMFSIITVIANQEHVRISERTKVGIRKALASGNKVGRRKTSIVIIKKIKDLKKDGISTREAARQLKISHSTARKYFNS